MPNHRRFSQTPPDKANELFERLLATTDTALKTRERLFADLKEELELLATLQEQHLFPVLRRHGMQDLVQSAVNDNQETIALLEELERMPKNSSEFLGRIARLRSVFQQHIRDDRKELIPAVLEVLSEEEAEAVIEQVEDTMASIGETKRAEAQNIRERTGASQHAADEWVDTMRASAESAQALARTMQQAFENSFTVFSELTRRSTGQALQMLGRQDGGSQSMAVEATQNLRAAAQSGSALTHGLQDVSRECLELSQKRLNRNIDNLAALAQCRSMADLIAAQAFLIRDNMELTIDNSRRIAELAIQIAEEASQNVTTQVEKVEKTVHRVGRAA
ncbi:phasin family protein [Microvirga guangxiensis]|uniref:Hemerythrin HHE cation binding domain-containing protein n=1 Tax=Microvirga guangxiensis TaxID=549386 RepID=A0A1G5IQ83_9HYPH|nr:phasin family protein [Microvirga guangxiensis]SCY77759.1 Hemerythrin HHE cation binding domain-containing protein [Microvirga guangxiensis]